MKLYSGIVKCGTCGKELGKVTNVPEDTEGRIAAMTDASRNAFCPGHSRNLNIEIPAWDLQDGPIAKVASEARDTVASPAPEAPKLIDGIAEEDFARAALDESIPPPLDGEHIMGKDENGMATPMVIIGRNPPRADQLG